MKHLFITGYILIISQLAIGQHGNQTDNELHALYLPGNPYTASHINPEANYDNINISGDPAPQNEPSVCISRTNSDIVVAAWRDFRLGYLKPDVVRRIGYSYSVDGGKSWSESQLLPDPLPDHISQSDPVVACDMDGNFYISSTSRQPVVNYNREMLLYKSTDNGQTFYLHTAAVPGSGSQGEDKEWIFVDHAQESPSYNQLMIAWKSFGPSYGIKFRKSDVGGTNWSSTVPVSTYSYGQGANLTTTLDGNVIVVWWDDGVMYNISTNNGISFGTETRINYVSGNNNSSFPFICTDFSDLASRGNIYVCWADDHQGTQDDVWFQRSTDGGQTWLSQAVQVNDVAIRYQYWPSISCSNNGNLYVVYYDERDGYGIINAYIAYSIDQGNTWTNELLSSSSFSGNTPNNNVRFGDYIEIDAWDNKVVAVWTDDRAGNYDQEIYTVNFDLNVGLDPVEDMDFTLYQNSPNPFRNTTRFQYQLEKPAHVKLEIIDLFGNVINTLIDDPKDIGNHSFTWNSNLDPGTYYYRLNTGNFNTTKKLVIL